MRLLLFTLLIVSCVFEDVDESRGLVVLETATFGAGCFWGTEKFFRDQFPDIKTIIVGYSGGISKDPTYEDVSKGTTGHAEVVQILFNPAQTTYNDLVEFFF